VDGGTRHANSDAICRSYPRKICLCEPPLARTSNFSEIRKPAAKVAAETNTTEHSETVSIEQRMINAGDFKRRLQPSSPGYVVVVTISEKVLS